MASFRYLVHDVDQAVAFYTATLGFVLAQQYGPAMAILHHGDLELWLAGPSASAARPMADGARPVPGGWNRFVLPVTDLAATVALMRRDGVTLRTEIVEGPGGAQALCVDPSGNLIELFQARGA